MSKKTRQNSGVTSSIHSSQFIDIGISDKNRQNIANGLSNFLADTYTLYLMTHNFHWNVTGPMFNTLHLMFMTQYTELWNAIDPIAERIRALGFPAPGLMHSLLSFLLLKSPKGYPMLRIWLHFW